MKILKKKTTLNFSSPVVQDLIIFLKLLKYIHLLLLNVQEKRLIRIPNIIYHCSFYQDLLEVRIIL
jgi:hypothetical protein